MNLMIKHCFRSNIKKCYDQKIQKLYQMLDFSLAYSNKKDVDWELIELIAANIKKTAILLTSLIVSIRLLPKLKVILYLVLIKLLVILVILCRSSHQNNSNYFLILFTIYFYSAGTKIDIINLFNYLSLLVLYNIFLKKLKNIILSSAVFIKKQTSNRKLISI